MSFANVARLSHATYSFKHCVYNSYTNEECADKPFMNSKSNASGLEATQLYEEDFPRHLDHERENRRRSLTPDVEETVICIVDKLQSISTGECCETQQCQLHRKFLYLYHFQ